MNVFRISIALTLGANLVFAPALTEAAPKSPHAGAVAQQRKPAKGGKARSRKAPKTPAATPQAATPAETTTPEETSVGPALATPAKPPPMVPDPTPAKTEPLAASQDAAPPNADVAPAPEPGRRKRAEGVAGAFVIAAAGLDFGTRTLSYNDRLTQNLRTYSLAGAPSVGGNVELYPLAGTEIPVARDLGLTGGYHQAFALSSQTEAGESVSTAWSRFEAGLRFRGRIGETRPVVLGLDFGYKLEKFTFSGDGALTAEMPSVAYSCLRLGADARVPVGPVAITAGAAYLPVLSGGDVATRMRETSVGAVEGEVGVAFPFGSNFEARLGVNYSRYFYKFRPQPGDTYVAGGALDQVIRGQTALAFVY